jgi:hypothetical protein
VRLHPEPAASGFGRVSGSPLLDAELDGGPVGPAGEEVVWTWAGLVPSPGGRQVHLRLQFTKRDDGRYVLRAPDAAIAIDPEARSMSVEAGSDAVAKQLVTTYGLPLLLHSAPALLLHACAAVPPGASGAEVVCAKSGTGKSTLLAALISTGWTAVTEDVAVVDLRGTAPVVWPGPPWVRTAGDGPSGARELFANVEKRGWDISPWLAATPVPLSRIVVMDQSSGTESQWTALEAPVAVGALPQFVMWLDEPGRKAPATFGPTAKLAATVSVARMRLPREESWTRRATALLAG